MVTNECWGHAELVCSVVGCRPLCMLHVRHFGIASDRPGIGSFG
jgi:hypothetical protein